MKRILILLFTIIMILSTTSCGGASDTASKPSSSPVKTEQSSTVETTTDNEEVTDSSLPTDGEENIEKLPEESSPVIDTKGCEHVYLPPTCADPEVCAKCGVTLGKALGHSYSAATCTSPEKCKRCGLQNGQALDHDFAAAGCTTAPQCKRCGIVDGNSIGHKWSSEKCGRCGISITSQSSEKINIACVGDSITNGGYWKSNLYGHLPDYYNVSGFGVNGATGLQTGLDGDTKKAYINQSACKNSLDFEPDAVVIMLGTNDSKPRNWNQIKADNGEQYKKDILTLINTYRALSSEPQIFLALPPTAFSNSTNYDGINNSTIENDIIPLLQAVAKETGVTVIDTHTATQNASAHFKDGVHPSDDAGKEILAQTVAEAILKIYK